MPLFQVQDDDRPAFVFAASYSDALKRWEQLMAMENECSPSEVPPPRGIAHIADDDEIIVGHEWASVIVERHEEV